jgi:hypothetical protein
MSSIFTDILIQPLNIFFGLILKIKFYFRKKEEINLLDDKDYFV